MDSRKYENLNKGNQDDRQKQNDLESNKTSSMTTLIIWNVNKALEKNPNLELKSALTKAQENLENEQSSVSAIVTQRPDERHLSCALLAWHQLGHNHADSLYSFVVAQMNREKAEKAAKSQSGLFMQTKNVTNNNMPWGRSFIINENSDIMDNTAKANFLRASKMGPVLKLPVTPKPKVYIPVYNAQCGGGGLQKTGQDIKNRIEQACCLKSACLEKLITVDRETKELRLRLGKLAKREAERIELLQRAETAWRDLEMGYMRRLRTCVEKEEDIARQSAKLISDRNNNKEVCAKLVRILKPRGETAEQARATLQKLESDVCARACERLQMTELAGKEDAILAQVLCKSNQQDRDLLFKEEQALRKKMTIQNDLESIRGLTYETERAIKAELQGFKEQMAAVSKELLEEDALIEKLKKERDELLAEKKELIEDLEGCQEQCDEEMGSKCDVLKKKREKLREMQYQEIECKCKFPMETAVQVHRTPSLAALCYCQPEDRVKKTCSCTSIRSRLLSDLICTLFEGLQFEMADSSIKMPCQLLKCLEDSHNWDKSSVTKTNIRSFFAKMLCGELDIAIINSIEKYHARWIGASCADMGRPIPDFDADLETWQDRALAQKAQWMAEAMAEQMFQERVDDIMEQAQKVVSSAPPPCKCKPPPNLPSTDQAVFQCLIEPVKVSKIQSSSCGYPQTVYPAAEYLSHGTPIGRNLSSSLSRNVPERGPKLPQLAATERRPSLTKVTPVDNKTKTIALVSATTNTTTNNTTKKKQKDTKALTKIKNLPSENLRSQMLYKNDVMVLKAEVENLKKDSIKKQDWKAIEQTIKKLVQRTSGPELPEKLCRIKGNDKKTMENKNAKYNNTKSMIMKKKSQKPATEFKRQYAVNMCFCGVDKHEGKSGKVKLDEFADGSNATFNLDNQTSVQSKTEEPHGSSTMLVLNKTSSTKSGKQKLNEIIDGSNAMSGQYNCDGIKSQSITTMRQSMPIAQLSSEEKKQSDDHKTAKCGSGCGCFNRIPSSTSINKLLEKLMKWKSDLNEQPYINSNEKVSEHFKNISGDIKSNVNDVPSIICQSVVINNVPQDICELSKSGKMCQVSNGEKPEDNFELPATMSEYIGAVNLEKSNEHFCKCVVNNVNKCKQSYHNELSKESKKTKEDIQSTSFCKCKSKVSVAKVVEKRKKAKSEEYNQKKEFINQRKIKSYEFYNSGKIKDDTDNISFTNKNDLNKKSPSFISASQTKIQTEKNNPAPLLLENENNKKLEQDYSIGFNCDQNEQSDLNYINLDDLSCACDYQIKLLGVTLNSISKSKVSTFREQINEPPVSNPKLTKCHTLEEKSHESSSNCYPLKSMEHYDLFKNYKTNTDMYGLEPACRCDVKFDELKGLLENIYKDKEDAKVDKSLDTNNLKKDSKFDTSSLKEDFNDDKCICCVNLTDESNELEVNTFHLLQDHLKEKLEKLKNTCESSYCFKPDEEDKVLAKIFKKIKQTITDDTGKIACRCSENDTNKGSWQRAYNLLQEYLKIKISRVQCSCSVSDQNKKQTILPELTDKVCLLIEQDFERLKSICKCRNNVKHLSNKSSFNEEIPFEIPEKDINNIKKTDSKILNKGALLKELTSKSYIIATNNTSAQVIPNFETKSCDALKSNDPIKYTVETQSSNKDNSYLKKTCSVDCNLLDVAKTFSSQNTQYSDDNEQELEPNSMFGLGSEKSENNILNKFKELTVELKQKENPVQVENVMPFPYIGCTIDCTGTMNLGISDCPRSRINSNAKAIDEFWSTYTKSKTNNKNFSYLMENISKSKVWLPPDISYDYFKKPLLKTATTTDTKTNTYRVGGITLKDSREYVNKQSSHGGTNTEDDMLFTSLESDTTSEDYWCESKPETNFNKLFESPKKKSVHFLHRSKSGSMAIESSKVSQLMDSDCDCSKVPVCHVKMLVENIESKLANSECTCDSLSSKVCPVHSKRNA